VVLLWLFFIFYLYLVGYFREESKGKPGKGLKLSIGKGKRKEITSESKLTPFAGIPNVTLIPLLQEVISGEITLQAAHQVCKDLRSEARMAKFLDQELSSSHVLSGKEGPPATWKSLLQDDTKKSLVAQFKGNYLPSDWPDFYLILAKWLDHFKNPKASPKTFLQQTKKEWDAACKGLVKKRLMNVPALVVMPEKASFQFMDKFKPSIYTGITFRELCDYLNILLDDKVQVLDTGAGIIVFINDADENIGRYIKQGEKFDMGTSISYCYSWFCWGKMGIILLFLSYISRSTQGPPVSFHRISVSVIPMLFKVDGVFCLFRFSHV
jgi:hypothetical protein